MTLSLLNNNEFELINVKKIKKKILSVRLTD